MKVFPEVLAKRNKHGTAYWSLVVVMGIAIAICATGATFGIIMTIFSFCNTFSEIPNTLTPSWPTGNTPRPATTLPPRCPILSPS